MAAVRLLLLCLTACILGVSAQTCPAVGCGNGICDFGSEDCRSCPADCGLCPTCEGICGNQLCEKTAFESSCNCAADCGVCCVDGLCRGLENAINCPSDCTGDLIGSVYDIETLENVANASVVCRTQYSTFNAGTDNGGNFGLGGLAGNTYTCTATKEEYLPSTNSFNFFPGSAVRVNNTIRIGIRKPPAMLYGKVINGFGNHAIRGANVSCAINSAYAVKFTDRLGGYFFHDLKPGVADCQAGAEGYGMAFGNATAIRGKAIELNFVLYPKPSGLLGKVIDRSTGKPLAGAFVSCVASKDQSQLPNTTTDSIGAFSHFNLLDIEYMCTSRLTGYTRGKGFVCPPKGKNGTLILKMSPLPAVLSGSVIDFLTGAPLFNAPVTCTSTGYTATTSTFRDGSWTLGKVVPGTYTCNASYPTYFPENNYVKTVAPGESGVIIFPLKFPPANLTGRVTLLTYAGVSNANGASVSCLFGDNSTRSTTTAADGTYSFVDVGLGAASCVASLVDYSNDQKGIVIIKASNHTLNFQLVEIKGDLIVNVVELTTNLRISGAAVRCVSSLPTLTGTTNVNGTTGFSKVAPISYSCNATAFGYAEGFAPATLVPLNKITTITIVLTPLPGILLVQVVDNSTGFAIGLATTRVTPGTTTQTADQSGGTQWTVAEGTYVASASATGYSDGSTSGIIVLKGQTTTAVVRLNPLPGQLTINVVLGPANTPLPGALVSVSGSGFSYSTSEVASSADAKLTYTITTYGAYIATASLAGYTSDTKTSAVISRGGSATITLVLIALPGGVTVSVVDDSTGDFINGAAVRVDTTTQFTVAGFTTWNLTAATYTAFCSATGYLNNQTGPIVVTRGGSVTAQCRLVPIPGTLFVNVVDDATNAPLPGAVVKVVGESVVFTGFADVTVGAPGANASYSITAYGSYRATASLSGYTSDSRVSVVISRNESASVTLRLVAIPNIVNVEVRDNRTQLLISGSSVTFGSLAARIAADGTLQYTGIAAGTYTVAASAAGYVSNSTSTGPLVRNQTITIVIFLVELPCTVNVQVLNLRNSAAVANATVTLNNALRSSGLTNATGFISFTIAYDSANNISAVKFGFNDNFTSLQPACSRGGSVTVTIILEEVINLRIAARDVASPSRPFITSASITWNDIALTKSDPAEPHFRILTVTTLPVAGTCIAKARGFNDKVTTYTFLENASRDLIVSLAPQDFTLYFVPQELTVSSSSTTNVSTPLNVDYTGNIYSGYSEVPPGGTAANVLRDPKPITLGGFAVQISQTNASRSYSPNTTIVSTISSTTPLNNSAGQTLFFAARFQNIVPTDINRFVLSLSTDLDNMVVNRATGTNASVVVNVPAYTEIEERNLLYFISYKLNAAFIMVRVFAVNAAKTALTFFSAQDFVTCNLSGNRFSNYNAIGEGGRQYSVVIFEFPTTFGENIDSITVSFPVETFSATLSGWADPDAPFSQFRVLPANQETIVTRFSFNQQTLSSLFVDVPNAPGLKARDASQKMYINKDYFVVALRKKKSV